MSTSAPLFACFAPDSKAADLFCYTFAGRQLISDRPLELFGQAQPFPPAGGTAFRAWEASRGQSLEPPPDTAEAFRGKGFVAGQQRLVVCTAGGEDCWLDIADIGLFQVGTQGFVLMRQETEDASALELAGLGPTLILALALGGVFCLHTSAAVFPRGGIDPETALLFLGSSGAGKSTLARHLASRGWQQIADDLLPLATTADGVEARPDFPQPKNPRAVLRNPLLVQSFLLLDEAEEPGITLLSPAEATLALVRHTAASRLFPPSLMRRHLETLALWSRLLPVQRLSYPRRWNALDPVEELLRPKPQPRPDAV